MGYTPFADSASALDPFIGSVDDRRNVIVRHHGRRHALSPAGYIREFGHYTVSLSAYSGRLSVNRINIKNIKYYVHVCKRAW
jgi:hypothetical protein